MKIRVANRLSIGDEASCSFADDPSLAIVHACKDPCHRRAVGYKTRTIPSIHPHYLAMERGNHLFLNVIDPETPLFMMPNFTAFMVFMDRHIADREVLIHCNQGESRSRSLAMLYMSKRGLLPSESYEAAAIAFRAICSFNPSRGITLWLTKNWTMIA